MKKFYPVWKFVWYQKRINVTFLTCSFRWSNDRFFSQCTQGLSHSFCLKFQYSNMTICPSRKELLAIAQICLAVLLLSCVPTPTTYKLWIIFAKFLFQILAIINYNTIDLFDTAMYDIRLFEHQCVNVAICYVSLYYAFGTWFWPTNVATTQMMARLHVSYVHWIGEIMYYILLPEHNCTYHSDRHAICNTFTLHDVIRTPDSWRF